MVIFCDLIQKEILVNTSDYVYIIAEDEKHRTYSNCSSFQFDMQTVYQNYFEVSYENPSYWSIVKDLQQLIQNYESFNLLLKPSTQKKSIINPLNYESYFDLEEISKSEFEEIMLFYSNYGVCTKNTVFALYASEISTKIISKYPSLDIESSLFKMRLVDNFKITQPNIELMNIEDSNIILTPESSFQWEIGGGPNLWEETRRVNEKFEVEDFFRNKKASKYFLSIINLSKYSGQKLRRHYYTKCDLDRDNTYNNELSYLIKVYSWNQPDVKLPKPVNVTLALKVSCKLPSKLQIFTYDPYSPNIYVYNSKILGLEAVNIKNYAEHFFQVFAFDENLTPFYNFSSLDMQWKITKQTNSLQLSNM